MVMLCSGPHRDTITFIPYGDTIFALSTFVGDAASSTTDLPRKASRTVSTVWNGTRESAFTYTVSALKLLSAPGSVGSMPANTFPPAVMATTVAFGSRSEEHTSELQSPYDLV